MITKASGNSLEFLLLQQGLWQARVQHSEKSNPPKLPGHFGLVLEADGHGLKSCQVSRQSVFRMSTSHQNPIKIPSKSHQNPIKIPSCFQAHVNLSFRSPPLGLKFSQGIFVALRNQLAAGPNPSCVSWMDEKWRFCSWTPRRKP